MSKKILILLSFLLLQVTSYRAIAAIGDWKAYMAYSEVQEIEQAGNLIFVQASNNLYVYNQNDQSIQTFSKMDYLSDCGIQHIAYNKATKRLLILYNNANMDLMNISNYDVQNLSDYYSASTTGDKTVSDIYMYGKYAYMSNGFGIIKVNVANGEICDTYNLGFNVNWCEIKDNNIYAYSKTNGQYRALLTSNLLDKNNWSKAGGYVAKKQEDKSELKQIVSNLQPGGPKYNYFGFMKFDRGQLYTCGSGYNVMQDMQRPGCIQLLENQEWNIYEDNFHEAAGNPSYVDINCIDFNPLHPDTLFACGRTGLYKFADGKFIKHYSYDNSPLVSVFGSDKNYVVVQGLTFDSQGKLWLINSMNKEKNLLTYQDGTWTALSQNELSTLPNMSHLLIDSRNILWFSNDNWQNPAFYRYDIENNKLYSTTNFINQDGTKFTTYWLKDIKEDLSHNIWLATDAGPILIEKKETTKESPVLTQVKIPRNDGTNFADYLLGGVSISSIAIDGGNRKWFGTSYNGVYLISEDNMEEIHHFTSSNSPLLSDNIESIAINNTTGEVFFGTDKGLCSYMSNASKPNEKMTKDNVWAYPNPVKPDYKGLITITGLAFQADVKIVTSNGILVNQGISNGGSYTWDGRNMKGEKVASGIYMVETATNEGNQGTVCKIAIIR